MLISLSENNDTRVEVKPIIKGNSFVLGFSYHLLCVAYLYINISMQFIQKRVICRVKTVYCDEHGYRFEIVLDSH